MISPGEMDQLGRLIQRWAALAPPEAAHEMGSVLPRKVDSFPRLLATNFWVAWSAMDADERLALLAKAGRTR